MNEGLRGLERHEAEYLNDRIFIFGWINPLNSMDVLE